MVADPREVTDRLAGEWGIAYVASSPVRPPDTPPFVIAYLRDGDGCTELCILPREGPYQVFAVSTLTVGRLAREAVDIVTRHRR